MNPSWQQIGEAVQGQCRLMRHNALCIRPKPRCYQVFVVARRKVDKSVYTAAYSHDSAGFLVMREQRRRITGGCTLASGK